MKDGNAFIYHLSEGTDPALIDEYTKLRDEGCLQPTLGAIHCTALEQAELRPVGTEGWIGDLVAVLKPVALPGHDPS